MEPSMRGYLALTLAVVVTSFAAPAALACDGHQTAQAQTGSSVVASNTAAPSTTTTTTTAPATATSADAAPKAATFKVVTVEQVQQNLAAKKADKKPFAVFDANSKGTRESMGVIPTAVLLPSASSYDLALLPTDKATPVVFYCANEKCTASHTAAKRAMAAGFGDVAVLSAGIKGWVEAGKAIEKPVG
jgi:rhodanese-related sulfurtransferase